MQFSLFRSKGWVPVLLVFLMTGAIVLIHRFEKSKAKLEIQFSHYESNDAAVVHRKAVFKVRNIGDAPAVYVGYSKNELNLRFERKTSLGTWESQILMCGTGLIELVLLPGEEISGSVFISDPGPWRASVAYRSATIEDRLPPPIRRVVGRIAGPVPGWSTASTGEFTEVAAMN